MSSESAPIQCPNCHGNLVTVDKDKRLLHCEHCKTLWEIVHQSKDSGASFWARVGRLPAPRMPMAFKLESVKEPLIHFKIQDRIVKTHSLANMLRGGDTLGGRRISKRGNDFGKFR